MKFTPQMFRQLVKEELSRAKQRVTEGPSRRPIRQGGEGGTLYDVELADLIQFASAYINVREQNLKTDLRMLINGNYDELEHEIVSDLKRELEGFNAELDKCFIEYENHTVPDFESPDVPYSTDEKVHNESDDLEQVTAIESYNRNKKRR